jgi:Leucine-rich repeat (LRR) protein
MARPRCCVSTQSAISAVEATLAADQPSPTRNVPRVTETNPSAKATNSAPMSAIPTPGYITHSRPYRSEAQPSGIVKANMPAAWNEWENAIAVSE